MKTTLKLIVTLALCAAVLLSVCACSSGSKKADEPTEAASAETVTTAAQKTGDSTGTGKKVYLAGPMFNQAEKDYNLKITKILEEYGYEVFLPQRDGIEGALLEDKTEQEMVDMIFPLDVSNVKSADIIFMNLDGRVPDEGACVELGIGYACGKRCYGFKTDTRAAERSMDLNPMITGCMIKIFSDFDGDKMIEALRTYLDANAL